MKSKRTGVAKMVALVLVPLSLTAVVAKQGQQRKAEVQRQAELQARLQAQAQAKKATEQMLTELQSYQSDYITGDAQKARHIREFLDQGADPNAGDQVQLSPLQMAISYNAPPEVVRLLLQRGANTQPQWGHAELVTHVRAKVKDYRWKHYTNRPDHKPTPYPGVAEIREIQYIENAPQIIQMLKAAGAKE